MAFLEVSHLEKSFSTQHAVQDVSFSIEKGQIFGLLGPNGAGKTTVIRMITGITYPDQGSVLIEGQPFELLQQARRIGYMPEERGLYKKMKIGEQAIYLAQLKGLTKSQAIERAKYWFSRLKIESWWDKKMEDLSKGMSQKVQFVVTVLHDPDLIILDEPFSGLDPVNAELIKDEIFGMAKNGKTIIFSTHRMEQVEEICSQIALISQGRSILNGSVDAIKEQFKENLYEVTFASASSFTVNETLFEIVNQNSKTYRIALKPGISPNQVLQYLLTLNLPIIRFAEVLPSLNEIFIKLVEGSESVARAFES